MWNSGKVFNPICDVQFAGFTSDTLTLQKAGWQLSFERPEAWDGVRLALKYEPARIYAITNTVSMREFAAWSSKGHLEWKFPIPFQVIMMGNDVRFQIMPLPRVGAWSAFDAIPQYSESKEVKFEELIPFRPISLDAPEIVIAQDNVPAMLEAILKLQDPKQAEIRDRQRKEAWLIDSGLREPTPGHDPRRDIKAQIIAIAS